MDDEEQFSGALEWVWVPCPTCDGMPDDARAACVTCRGRGRVGELRYVRLSEAELVALRRQGEQG